jgi:hypothetical protein
LLSIVASLSIGVLVAGRPASGAQGDCSQPVSTGSAPVASDCLFILGVAVGLQSCTPQPCVCDPTGDGNATASDALLCLNTAVGGSTTLSCPCGPTTTTTTMPNGADCTNDGNCSISEDCVCPDCDDDLFCGDPKNCEDNGVCQTFEEGCVCTDCMNHPACAR